MLGTQRRQRQAAVAGQDRGHAVPDGGRAEPVPERLNVVMGVEVDDAGSDEQSLGIDRPVGRAANAANLRDRSVLDRDIGLVAREPGAVDDHPVPDQQVIGHTILRRSCLASARMITLRARGVQHGVSPGTLQSAPARVPRRPLSLLSPDRKSTRLNSSHGYISYAVFCLKKKKKKQKYLLLVNDTRSTMDR